MNALADTVLDPTNYRTVSPSNPFVDRDDVLGRDDFLTLLVAQLENQDPLEPQKDTEFVAQLATFSSLEQLIDLNKRMDGVISGQDQLVNAQAMDMIGREVLVDTGGRLRLGPDGRSEEIFLELDSEKVAARVEIYDADGRPVRTIPLESTAAGRYRLRWDGLDDDGNPAAPGEYEFRLVTTDATGKDSPGMALVVLPVEGLHFGEDGLSMVSGTRTLPFGAIVEILDPGAGGVQVSGGSETGQDSGTSDDTGA